MRPEVTARTTPLGLSGARGDELCSCGLIGFAFLAHALGISILTAGCDQMGIFDFLSGCGMLLYISPFINGGALFLGQPSTTAPCMQNRQTNWLYVLEI